MDAFRDGKLEERKVIGRDEVRELAREFQLDVHVVEKDYVLGWLLAGVAADPELRDGWIFKGGTCLKKCYFETYRFSEDLDFTLRDAAHLNEAFLLDAFGRIGDWVYEQCGIELPQELRRFEVFNNPQGHPAVQGRLGYRGPHARAGDAPRIKLDLVAAEVVVLDPVRRPVHHPYSDRPEEGIEVLCYAFEEVFAEKIRALAERQRPRDLYDVIHLHRQSEFRHAAQVRSTLARKCEFKRIPVPTFQMLSDRPERQAIEAEWDQMLAHQLPVCPPFAEFWAELPRMFEWLEEPPKAAPLPSIGAGVAPPAGGMDASWRMPPMVARWGYPTSLEAIRFAGANRLLVELDYEAENGERSTRTIEPYALRRSNAGDILLYALRADSGATRAYRVDRIQGARVLRRTFSPRFAVELTTGFGSGDIPPVSDRPRELSSTSYAQSRRVTARPAMPHLYGAPSGPTYVYECVYCHKRFNRRSMDGTLRPHKDKRGWDCPGRTGMYKQTNF
ncbi:MAG: nucleotidyl transferase AbiEii/AbiGii toxin family protein [Burkholderiales bacterium]